MIFTGYFSKLKDYNLDGLQLISIANNNPAFGKLAIKSFRPLAPGNWIYAWKNNLKNRSDLGKAKLEYINTYYTKCLNQYTPKKLFEELTAFTGGHDAVLLCYEVLPQEISSDGIVDLSQLIPGKDFCHRHLVSNYLRQGGYCCKEILNNIPSLFDDD